MFFKALVLAVNCFFLNTFFASSISKKDLSILNVSLSKINNAESESSPKNVGCILGGKKPNKRSLTK